MRQLGTVQDEQAAHRFADYLLTKGTPVSVERGENGFRLWVRNEDQLEDARREFAQFTASPDAPAYQQAGRAAEQIRAEEGRRSRQARKNFVKMSDRWRAGVAQRAPLTMVLIAASVIVTILTKMGNDPHWDSEFWVAPSQVVDGGFIFEPLSETWYSQPWRLITPIFMHFSIWHILFNMMWLLQLGTVIEMLRGSLRFAILVLMIAVISNVAQYLWAGPLGGGMSGVVYGLFGYIWMKSRYEPGSGFNMPRNTVILMLGWFVLCTTGWIGNIANAAHGVGLVVGAIAGRWRSAWQQLR
jgi:GlpG protein